MSLSRILKVLSLSVLVMMGNAVASTSSLLEEADNLSEYSLRRYLATAQTLVADLEGTVSEERRAELKNLKDQLQGWQQSVNYLVAFQKDKRIYQNTDNKRAIHTHRLEQGPNPVNYYPRSNIHMGYVHGSKDSNAHPIGFSLYFGEIDPSCLYSRRTISSGYIPFNNFFRCREEGDLRKILASHAFGVPFPKGEEPEFYDEQASLEVRQFLYHARNLETFFTKGEVLPQYSEYLTAYQSVLKALFSILGAEYKVEITKNKPHCSSEEWEQSWRDWKKHHVDIMSLMESTWQEKYVKFLHGFKILIQFTPYDTVRF